MEVFGRVVSLFVKVLFSSNARSGTAALMDFNIRSLCTTTTSEVGEFQTMHSGKFKEENVLSRVKFKGP